MHAVSVKNRTDEHAECDAGKTGLKDVLLRGFFSVFVKTLTGKTFMLQIDNTYTILKIKHVIRDMEGIPSEQQRLISHGRQLQDNRTVYHYRITKESTMHLVLSLRGT